VAERSTSGFTFIEEADAIAASSGTARSPHASLLLAAWRGREEEAQRLVADCVEDATARGEARLLAIIDCADAVLYNGLGRYRRALVAGAKAIQHDDPTVLSWAAPELVEAAGRSGRPALAARALDRVRGRPRAGGGEWARGMEARSRALLSEGEVAEGHYREAIERLRHRRLAPHLARARLLYGEWLRRERRRVDAREQLRPALDTFVSIGAQAFAARAERELAATAATVRVYTVDNVDELTPQEETIARLARDGYSNPEIGIHLFISPRTVEYHLRKVFRKLDVRSRHELRGALAAG